MQVQPQGVVVPHLRVGGIDAFFSVLEERLRAATRPPTRGEIDEGKTGPQPMKTWNVYYSQSKRCIGHGQTEVFSDWLVSGQQRMEAIMVSKLSLDEIPSPENVRSNDFIKKVAQRHGWRRDRNVSNGQVECAIIKIYDMIPEKTPAIAWSQLFPETAPQDPDSSDDQSQPVVDIDDEEIVDGEDEEVEADPDPPAQLPVVVPRTFVFAGVRVPVPLLALGTAILADPGGGKTYMIKHLLDQVVEQLPSIRNIVIVDMKGDLSQIVESAPGISEDDNAFDGVFFEVMTFASAVGTWSTLSGFDARVDVLETLDLSVDNPLIHRDACKFASIAKGLAQDLLLNVVVKTKNGAERLGGGVSVPSGVRQHNAHGTLNAKDEEVLAERLSTALVQVYLKCRKAGVGLPRSYEDLLSEIRCAYQPHCRNSQDAEAIDENSLAQEDLDVLAKELFVRTRDVSWSALYRPARESGADSVVPLNGDRLLAPPPAGYSRRITVVNCALFGLPGVDDMKKRTIASTVITRMERQATMQTGGTQESPTSMLLIDEASFVMPNSTSKSTGPDVSAVVAVKKLLKMHRDKGMAVVLATQRPKDLHPDIRSVVTGVRMIGKFQGEKSEQNMMLDSVVKDNSLRSQTKKMVDDLKSNQFAMIKDGQLHKVRANRLKRLHESSSLWAQTEEFTLPQLMSDAPLPEAVDHPLAPFTRRVRMRFA